MGETNLEPFLIKATRFVSEVQFKVRLLFIMIDNSSCTVAGNEEVTEQLAIDEVEKYLLRPIQHHE